MGLQSRPTVDSAKLGCGLWKVPYLPPTSSCFSHSTQAGPRTVSAEAALCHWGRPCTDLSFSSTYITLHLKTPTYGITSDLHFWGVSQGWGAHTGDSWKLFPHGTARLSIRQLHLERTLNPFNIAPRSTSPLIQVPEMPAASPKPGTLEKYKVGEGGVKKGVTCPITVLKILYLPISPKRRTRWACGPVLPLAGKGAHLETLKRHALHSRSISKWICGQRHRGVRRSTATPAGGSPREPYEGQLWCCRQTEATGSGKILILKINRKYLPWV